MNKEDLNMDKLLREKLEGFSLQPPSHVWNNIQQQLLAQKRQRKIVFLSRVAAAAVVIMAFVAGWYLIEKSEEIVPQTVKNELIQPESDTEKQESSTIANSEKINETGTNSETLIQPNSNTLNSRSENRTTGINFENEESALNHQASKPLERMQFAFLEAKKAKIENQQKTQLSVITISSDEFTSEDRLLIAENLKVMDTKDDESAKWKMGLYVSPGYSSQSASYSETYSNNMVHSNNNGNSNVTGGFSVQYKTGKNWSIETGIYYEQNGKSSVNTGRLFSKNYEYAFMPQFDTDGMYISDAINSINGNMLMNSVAGVIEFSGTPAGTEVVANLDGNSYSSSNVLLASGEYSQVFEFIEIPLYFRYSILDSKFGLEIIGGFNTGFIAGNSVFLDDGSSRQNIGRTKDISKINLSSTVGVGLNYALSKRISLAVEPRFNYYLNSLNQNSNINFRPYRIGVYTGLNYEF